MTDNSTLTLRVAIDHTFFRSPPNKARLSVESNTNVLGSGDRLRVSALPMRTRLSVPDESFLFFVDDTNETTVLSGTAHDTSVLANGDTSESFIFKVIRISVLLASD